ncbi:hypothetical protein [Zoogloea oryzae]|uniref:hypothetical protein n=1 Tax=Zoogloea oryzae TaxID=310767 RepID=UPI0024E118C8|nr:hypothetical protein [Zoogloea oryzae]
MDDANSGLEGCADSLYYPVRRPDEQPLTQTHLHKIPDTLRKSVAQGIKYMSSSGNSHPEFFLPLHLISSKAEGLAHLFHVMEWSRLEEHSDSSTRTIEARYALAKLRFALSGAGYLAMPSGKGSASSA